MKGKIHFLTLATALHSTSVSIPEGSRRTAVDTRPRILDFSWGYGVRKGFEQHKGLGHLGMRSALWIIFSWTFQAHSQLCPIN